MRGEAPQRRTERGLSLVMYQRMLEGAGVLRGAKNAQRIGNQKSASRQVGGTWSYNGLTVLMAIHQATGGYNCGFPCPKTGVSGHSRRGAGAPIVSRTYGGLGRRVFKQGQEQPLGTLVAVAIVSPPQLGSPSA